MEKARIFEHLGIRVWVTGWSECPAREGRGKTEGRTGRIPVHSAGLESRPDTLACVRGQETSPEDAFGDQPRGWMSVVSLVYS